MEYLCLIRTILFETAIKMPQKLVSLQFYFIKNELLHFLIEELQAIQTNDKELMKNYF
jgi:hypothetical protein